MRPRELLHVFELPFVPSHLPFHSRLQMDWMMVPGMSKEKTSSKKQQIIIQRLRVHQNKLKMH